MLVFMTQFEYIIVAYSVYGHTTRQRKQLRITQLTAYVYRATLATLTFYLSNVQNKQKVTF